MMEFYDKQGNKYNGTEDGFSIGFKKNGQGYIRIMINDTKQMFTFYATNEKEFLICMKNIYKLANESTIPS